MKTMYTREEQKIINKFDEMIDSESTSVWDNFLYFLYENDLDLAEVLFHLYEKGLIKVPDDFEVDDCG